MKKLLLTGMILMLGVSSAGFSARYNDKNSNRGYNESYKHKRYKNDDEKRYNQIYARYSGRIKSLEASLRSKDVEIKRARTQKKVDWKRLKRLNSERKFIKKES